MKQKFRRNRDMQIQGGSEKGSRQRRVPVCRGEGILPPASCGCRPSIATIVSVSSPRSTANTLAADPATPIARLQP